MKPTNLQQHLAGILDNLEAINEALTNLNNKQDTKITDFDQVNKRISEKIHSYIIQTDKLKLDFLDLLAEDGEKIAAAAKNNPQIGEEIVADLGRMADLCDDIIAHEEKDMEYSEKTIDKAKEVQDTLNDIKKDTEKTISKITKQQQKETQWNRTNRPL